MDKVTIPPVRSCKPCGSSKSTSSSEYWINKDPDSPYYMHWMIGDVSTGVDSRGTPGITPHIGANGNWHVGNVDTGVPASGIVIESGPQSASELFL